MEAEVIGEAEVVTAVAVFTGGGFHGGGFHGRGGRFFHGRFFGPGFGYYGYGYGYPWWGWDYPYYPYYGYYGYDSYYGDQYNGDSDPRLTSRGQSRRRWHGVGITADESTV